jgi:23S rRNA pseudouridine1911/1915/1917 synthase
VPEGLVGVRLDVAVARLFGLSRTAAAALIDSGDVLVDGGLSPRSARLADGSLLEVRLPDAVRDPMPPQVVDGLAVLYDDADVVVVDKPAGVAAHPSPGWTGPTVVSGLSAMGYQVATSGAAERQGIVHRLDVGTTGVMAVAKSERAYSVLKRAFKTRAVEKRYAALAQGHPDPTSGTIDAPIGRHPSADYKFAVVAGGRPSITHYATEEAFRAATLLDIQLETGRTHQIRVHLAAIRHPCVGDLTYGADPVLAARLGLSRQGLHARELGFAHPTSGEWMAISAPDPPDLLHALDLLRRDG